MGVFREQLREGRRILHEDMSVPALYFMEDAPDDAQLITVRVHDKWLALGDMKGTNFNYAEVESIAPQIVFMLSEISPSRMAIVSIEAGVAYRIDSLKVPNDITITANVARLSPAKTQGLPVP